jgi:PKD repeat protein
MKKVIFIFLLAAISFASKSQTVTNTVTLDGSGSSDSDGTIASYKWEQISGPVASTITNSTSAKATVVYTTAGVYKYQLTVTDDKGASGTATTQVTVLAANIPPKAVITIAQGTTIQLK